MDWLGPAEEPVDVTVTIPPSAPDWISLGLLLALVVVTYIYVRRTGDMVDEMRSQRAADVADRRREKSDRAAYRCLETVRQLSDEMTRRGVSAVKTETLAIAHATLRGEGSLIGDPDVRHRVGACAEVVFVGSFSTEQMDRERLSAGRVALGVHEILRATRSVLQEYLAEQVSGIDLWERPDQDRCGNRLPDIGSAAAWIRCVGASA